MIFYLSIIGLLLLVMCPVYFVRMTRAYADEVRRLEQQVAQLAVARDELDVDLAGLVAQEEDLHRQHVELVEAARALPSLGGEDKGQYKTPQEYLLAAEIITPEDVNKAARFKDGSKSPYDLGEILVMMDTISPAELSLAKSKVGG